MRMGMMGVQGDGSRPVPISGKASRRTNCVALRCVALVDAPYSISPACVPAHSRCGLWPTQWAPPATEGFPLVLARRRCWISTPAGSPACRFAIVRVSEGDWVGGLSSDHLGGWLGDRMVRQSAPALGPGGPHRRLPTRELRVATVPPSRQCPTDPAALSDETFVKGTALTCP
jgi:hypothetical protein